MPTFLPLALALLLPVPEPTVKLVIDFGDGVEWHFTKIAHREGLTVLDAMKSAGTGPRKLAFKVKGEGELAFLTEIAGAANEGGAAGKRNWVFRVNDELGRSSCGVAELKPDDVAKWTYSARGLAP